MRNLIFYRLILFTGLILIAFFVNAQQKTVETDTIAQKTETELIPLTEIPNKLPEATSEIRRLNKAIVPDSILVFQVERLDTFLLNFDSFQNNPEEIDTGKTTQIKLENQLYIWNKQKSQLKSIQNDLEGIRNKLNDQKESVDEILLVWQHSKEAIEKEKEVPKNVLQIVNSFIDNIGLVKDTLNQKNEIIYTELEKIAQTTITIDENISDIESGLKKVTDQLLTTKDPSLFYAIFKSTEKIELFGDVSSNFKRTTIPFNDFFKNNANKLIFHAIFLMLLIVLFLFVKKNLNYNKFRKMDKKLIQGALVLFENPIITSLLLALIFSFIIYPDAPDIVKQLIFLLLLLPLMVLVPKLIEKELRYHIYGLGFIYLLFNYLDFAFYNSIIEHLIKIIVAFIVFYGLRNILKSKTFSKIFLRKGSTNIFKGLFSLFAFILVVGIIAIFIGYNMLGQFLIQSVIASLYAFMLFYAGYQAIAGLLELTLNSEGLKKFNVIKKHYDKISTWINSALYTGTILFLFYTILFIFKIQGSIINAIIVVWNFGFDTDTLKFSIGNIIIFFFTLWISILLSKIIGAILEEDALKKFKLKRGVPRTISVMVKYALITIGFLVAIAAAGFKLQSLTIVIGALGVGIGFGLQDVINNFISGLILLFERPIQIGDTIQVGELWGDVKQIGIRSSVIRTFSGSEVIVPNGMLISQQVTNWTLSDSKRRLDVEVGVAYGTELNRVIEILKKCANDHKEVMDDPAPSAWFTGFGDSSINFKLVFWYPSFNGGLTVKSQVALAVDDALKDANITIPFPQQDVYIKEIKDSVAEKLPIVKKAVAKKTPPKNSSSSTNK